MNIKIKLEGILNQLISYLGFEVSDTTQVVANIVKCKEIQICPVSKLASLNWPCSSTFIRFQTLTHNKIPRISNASSFSQTVNLFPNHSSRVVIPIIKLRWPLKDGEFNEYFLLKRGYHTLLINIGARCPPCSLTETLSFSLVKTVQKSQSLLLWGSIFLWGF